MACAVLVVERCVGVGWLEGGLCGALGRGNWGVGGGGFGVGWIVVGMVVVCWLEWPGGGACWGASGCWWGVLVALAGDSCGCGYVGGEWLFWGMLRVRWHGGMNSEPGLAAGRRFVGRWARGGVGGVGGRWRGGLEGHPYRGGVWVAVEWM